VGADSEAHGVAVGLGLCVVIHPPLKASKRANCHKQLRTSPFEAGAAPGPTPNVHLLKPQEYIVRNREIVDSTDFLVACPLTSYETLSSGSWATVRYARSKSKKVHLIRREIQPLQGKRPATPSDGTCEGVKRPRK
jgi:hypothetical protein